ncbi:MAG: hypothetical protein ACR2NP_23050 [Pirellulaceae bacterium]
MPTKNAIDNGSRAPGNQPAQATNKLEPHPEVGKFNEAQLGKDHTLFVLAFDSITRQTYFLANFRHLMNDDQVRQTRELVDSYDGRYAELRDERARILENAADGQDIDTMLLNNRVETLLMGRDLRRKLFREILTEEQQKLHLEESAERRARREALEKAAAETKQTGSSQ